MGKLTDFIGGQTVTDNGVTGERNFVRVGEMPASPEAGIIYMTPTTIQNASVITGYTVVTASLARTATNVEFNVVGPEGAQFTIVASGNGINSNTGTLTIGTDVSSGVNFTRTLVTEFGGFMPGRDITFTIQPNTSSDPITVLEDGLIASYTINQAGYVPIDIPVTVSGNTQNLTGGFQLPAGTGNYLGANIMIEFRLTFGSVADAEAALPFVSSSAPIQPINGQISVTKVPNARIQRSGNLIEADWFDPDQYQWDQITAGSFPTTGSTNASVSILPPYRLVGTTSRAYMQYT